MTALYVRENESFREAKAEEVIACAQGLIARRFRVGAPVLDSPERTHQFLKLHLGALDHEVFACLFLDNRHRLIEYVELFRGTFDGASVHPREIVKEALKRNAAALILVHPHPSGIAEPSRADELVTTRIRDALALIDVRVLDHLIIAERVYSFAQHGRI